MYIYLINLIFSFYLVNTCFLLYILYFMAIGNTSLIYNFQKTKNVHLLSCNVNLLLLR